MGSTATHFSGLDASPALAVVETWLARQPLSPDLTWYAFADPDGAVGLIPGGPDSGACLALLLTEQTGGYGVTACDPDDPVELGVFATIEDALQSVGRWMAAAMSGSPGHVTART